MLVGGWPGGSAVRSQPLSTAPTTTTATIHHHHPPCLQLKAALQGGHFTLSPAEAEQLLEQVSLTQSGTIDYKEWVAAMADWREVSTALQQWVPGRVGGVVSCRLAQCSVLQLA